MFGGMLFMAERRSLSILFVLLSSVSVFVAQYPLLGGEGVSSDQLGKEI